MIVRFVCTRCGKCCMNFGRYIVVEKEMGTGRVQCRNRLDGEVFIAVMGEGGSRPCSTAGGNTPCRFLECDARSGIYSCRIYATRPRLCREFRCRRLEVMDASGNRVGRLAGEANLVAKDERLSKLWESQVKPQLLERAGGWEERVTKTLEAAGYRVVIYE